MMKTLFLLLVFSTAYAYQSVPWKFTVANPKFQTMEVDRSSLKSTRLEVLTKNDLARIRLQTPSKFLQLKNNKLENSALYQSWIEEVNESLLGKNKMPNLEKTGFYKEFIENSKIEMAKKIAKQQMLLLIKRNWPRLKESIFNEYGIDNWKNAEIFTLRLLNENFFFVPRPQQNSYLFMLGDSFVELDKNLKKGMAVLDIDSRLDSNSLPPDADKIIPDDQGESSSSSKIKVIDKKEKSSTKEEAPVSDSPDLEIF